MAITVTTVRYDGITHDFMMLNPLSGTHATRAAVAQAISVLGDAAVEELRHDVHRAASSDRGAARPPGRGRASDSVT